MRKILNNNRGITLIEAIVSLLLITIILISFYGMFIQSKKTNSNAESISDATYLAQTEMEKVYQISKSQSISDLNSKFISGYTLSSNKNIKVCPRNNQLNYTEYSSEIVYEKALNSNYKGVITIRPLCDFAKSATVLIDIIDTKNIIKATVENVYVWN
ncbi:type IV pilus modification PilV family protein [Ureibacillus composti]